MGKIFIGVSGWTFPGWRGTFYPQGVSQKRELEYAAQVFNALEINGTFYSLQKPTSFQSWYNQTPEGFVFGVKGNQYITHIRRLKEIDTPLAFFLGSGLLSLKEKLGPILWQFPPNVILKDDRFEKFLKMLPKDTLSARRYLRKFRERLRFPEVLEWKGNYPLKYAIEVRHKSFFVKPFFDLLKEHGVALVGSHDSERFPACDKSTAPFAYLRLHGEGPGMKRGYNEERLAQWAKICADWQRKRDIYVFLTPEAKKFAPANAIRLSELLHRKAGKRGAA